MSPQLYQSRCRPGCGFLGPNEPCVTWGHVTLGRGQFGAMGPHAILLQSLVISVVFVCNVTGSYQFTSLCIDVTDCCSCSVVCLCVWRTQPWSMQTWLNRLGCHLEWEILMGTRGTVYLMEAQIPPRRGNSGRRGQCSMVLPLLLPLVIYCCHHLSCTSSFKMRR